MGFKKKLLIMICVIIFVFLFNANFSITYKATNTPTVLTNLFFQTVNAQERIVELVEKTLPATGIIYVYDKDENLIGFGSGFFISNNNHFITNRHVLENVYLAEIKSYNGDLFQVKSVIGENKKNDLIRLTTDSKKKISYHLPVNSSLPKLGERIIVIGSPLGYSNTISEGIVSAIRENQKYGSIIQISAPISKGSSGSPVLNMKGEVVGIVTFMVDGPNLNFAIPSSKVKRMDIFQPLALEAWAEISKSEWLLSAEGLNDAGEKLMKVEKYSEAAAQFKKAVRKESKYSMAYLNLGNCLANLGDYASAVESYTQAIKYKKDYYKAYLRLAIVYNELREYSKAIKLLENILLFDPNNAEVFCNLGSVYYNVRDFDKAALSLVKAIRLKPNNSNSYFKLGLCYCMLRNNIDAIKSFRLAIIMDPYKLEGYFNLYTLFLNEERYLEAFETYEQLQKIDPAYTQKYINLSILSDKIREKEMMVNSLADYTSYAIIEGKKK